MGKLNATSATILGFLQQGPMSGWELASTIDRSVGFFWNVTQSQVYRELGALAESALVRDAGQKGRATRYATTALGSSAFEEWINRAPGPSLIRLPVVLGVFFGRHVKPERLHRFLLAEKLSHEGRLDAYLSLESHVEESPYERASLELGIAYERMMMAWIDGLPWLEGGDGKKVSKGKLASKKKAKPRA